MVELNLTKRQREIFEYVKRYGEEHGYPPTVRDIGKAIGLTSSSTVHAHLANLEKLGLLRRDPKQAAGDRGAGRQGEGGGCAGRASGGRAGCRGPVPCWLRRTSRSTSRFRRSPAATRAGSFCG